MQRVGGADAEIRRAVFEWLSEQRQSVGEAISRTALETFAVGGVRVPLVGPRGIWKPAVCELPISIATTMGGPYSDAYDEASGELRYSYRGTDQSFVNHVDNVGLRRAMTERVPLVYFHAIAPGSYVAEYPIFVIGDDPASLTFTVRLERPYALGFEADFEQVAEDPDVRREYVVRSIRQRVHQATFRERVIRAYQERCALCSLRHTELLDAAHITPDLDPEGDPVVSNGVALCKLHHAAFDRFFFAIRPDYVVEVRPAILVESDGPMLVVGLQQIHGRRILLPRRQVDRPDPLRLQRRFEEFRRAG